MAKYKIDYHEQTGRFFIKFKDDIASHKSIAVLLAGIRKKHGPGGYTMTRKARKNHG